MKDKLNIALIRKKYLPEKGGTENDVTQFVNRFTAKGHHISLFSELFMAEENELLKWYKVPKSSMPGFCRPVAFHRQAQRMLTADRLRDSFDIIYSLCRTFPVDILRVTEQLHTKWLPIGYSRFARLNPRHRGILKLEKRIFDSRNSKFIVVNSNFIKQQIIEEFNYPADKIRVIYNGMNHDKFFPATSDEKQAARKQINIDPKRNICLFAATDFETKGLAEAIAVIASVKEELRNNTLLLVVGDDKSTPFIKLAEEYGVAKNIIFAGHQENMRDYYIAADILLYPSRYEVFSDVCLEALGCGLPIITTRQIGAYELIDEAVNGFSVTTSDNIEEMAHFLAAFFELPLKEKNKFSRAASDSVSDFTWRKHINLLEELFFEVTEIKRSQMNRK